MVKRISPHTRAVLQALFVTLIWSASWVLVKIGLEDIPALTFAGLRYMLAFITLLPLAVARGQVSQIRQLPRRTILKLALLGLLYYTITQGAQFLALNYLPAITLSLLLNFTALITALLAIPMLKEFPTGWQWIGVAIFLGGVLVYFYPVRIPLQETIGLAIGMAGVVANSLSSVLGRSINRRADLDAMTVTLVSMGIGAALLLGAGLIIQGLPRLSLLSWGIIVWLAIVHTAFTFTLWNQTLRTLSATESSVINNTMLIQIAVLAWIFLGERIGLREGIGLLLAMIGIVIVQLRSRKVAKNEV